MTREESLYETRENDFFCHIYSLPATIRSAMLRRLRLGFLILRKGHKKSHRECGILAIKPILFGCKGSVLEGSLGGVWLCSPVGDKLKAVLNLGASFVSISGGGNMVCVCLAGAGFQLARSMRLSLP